MDKQLQIVAIQVFKFLLLVFCFQFAPPYGHSLQSHDQASTSAHLQTLKWVSAGEGRATDGTFLDMNGYETPDGIQVGITTGKFKSSKAAEHEFKLWLKSTAIATKNPIRNDFGRIIGTRAEASFSTATAKHFAILWTKGERFVWISSPSMPLCRQVEAQTDSHLHR